MQFGWTVTQVAKSCEAIFIVFHDLTSSRALDETDVTKLDDSEFLRCCEPQQQVIW